MNPWMLLVIITLCLFGLSLVFLALRISGFSFIRRLAGGNRRISILTGMLILLAAVLFLYKWIGLVNTVVCAIHLAAFWLAANLVCAAVPALRRNQRGKDIAGAGALALCICYLGFGWFTAHHVVKTEYRLVTDKDLGGKPLRIVLFADSHIGSTFHADTFRRYCREMEEQSPDIVICAGDFIDDDTRKEDMAAACEALGSIRTKYGVFFVYGNHDRGYYGQEYRGYEKEDVARELEQNGVTILCDETVLIDGRFYLIGREDARFTWRADMKQLTDGLDTDKYMVVGDHEPHDYDAQEKSGVDLVLSGHTHGGWMLPVNRLAEWAGTDCKTYGHEKRSGTDFIVTSGISEWVLKFKTGTVSEYVVITVEERTV